MRHEANVRSCPVNMLACLIMSPLESTTYRRALGTRDAVSVGMTTRAATIGTTYTVSADIEYLDGALAGLTIPAGYLVSFPTRPAAHRAAAWVRHTRRADDVVRATGTGNKYRFVGRLVVSERNELARRIP